MNQVMDGPKTRKLILQLVTGAVVGAAVTYFFLENASSAADFDDPARLTAVAAGIIYVLMGAIVAIGAIVPGAGAKFLNVEDAAEIVEERGKLAPSAIVCILLGAMLLALALTPGGELPGALSRDTAAWVAAGCFAALVVASRGCGARSTSSTGRWARNPLPWRYTCRACCSADGAHWRTSAMSSGSLRSACSPG